MRTETHRRVEHEGIQGEGSHLQAMEKGSQEEAAPALHFHEEENQKYQLELYCGFCATSALA